ncbi:hypothetical protein [Paenibacillus bouchesdurhonensis]|uniref:hypothetical protein n=1 Tax=Paenibacillus bouchesdurhonensis TaxID=1870990 RepID=UPI000DA5F590|nr:hypothetical protein [Paenibacillus bouchesdurhonensis]
MDEKTLQYMGERVDKAHAIKKKIAELNEFIQHSEGKDTIRLSDGGGYVQLVSYNFDRLSARAKVAVLKEVEEEIKLLEQEFAQL